MNSKHYNKVLLIPDIAYPFFSKYFDFKMGFAGAFVLAIIVFVINADHGVLQATTASLKQGVYTFIAGGFMMRLTENMAIKTEHWSAYIYAVGLSTLIAVSLTFLLHSLKGTPEPLNSTLPTLILAPPGFFWWSYQKRRQLPKGQTRQPKKKPNA